MAPAGGLVTTVVMRALRQAVASTSSISRSIQSSLSSQNVGHQFQHLTVRASHAIRQPIHPAAVLRQSRRGTRRISIAPPSRLNTAIRRFIGYSTASGKSNCIAPPIDRTVFSKSTIGRDFASVSGRIPFAHALRPNLTGGALPRTAGGYATPGSGRVGGQRYFSHAPASQAHVVQNVSQAMRAFWLSGQRAQFDGYNANGGKMYRPISTLQRAALREMAMSDTVPGSYISFPIGPTFTALSPLTVAAARATASDLKVIPAASGASLNTEGFLDVLSADFARQLKVFAAILADLKRLATLGDLPVALEENIISVRFPGLDADTVERLCDDIGVQRGIIRQDSSLDDTYDSPMALRFPFAPGFGEAAEACTASSVSQGSHLSNISSREEDKALFDMIIAEDLREDDLEESCNSILSPLPTSSEQVSDESEGLQGIYSFLEECNQLQPQSSI